MKKKKEFYLETTQKSGFMMVWGAISYNKTLDTLEIDGKVDSVY